MPALNEQQQAAVCCAVRENAMVLTGGPGTGKTTTCREIIRRCEDAGLDILCAAPTGKASKRLQEQTGMAASTIHRLLQWSPQAGGFTIDHDNPLDAGVVLVDETSMVDTMLMQALLDAMQPGTKLVLVGDVDQLPSIGAGNVLRDIIDSRTVPVVRLEQVYRQSENSWIRVNAQRINRGERIHVDNDKSEDFFFIEHEKAERAAEEIIKLVTRDIPARHGLDPIRDVQVLCPQWKGTIGVHLFNAELQAALNPRAPGKAERKLGREGILRVGDKVIHTRNNYELGVYNGEVGIVTSIDKSQVKVDFEDRGIAYDSGSVSELQHCFATTIHKCVSPNTLVETEEGLLPIRAIAEHGVIGTPDGPRTYDTKVENGAGDLLEVRTRHGYTITVTPDHGLDVWDGHSYRRVEAAKIRQGSFVRLRLGAELDPDEPAHLAPPPPGDVRAVRHPTPDLVTREVAEFLGLMVADGTVYQGGFRLGKRHADVAVRFADLCERLFHVTAKRYVTTNTYFAEVNSTILSAWLLSLGGLAPHEKAVPSCILRSPRSIHAAFLRGLFEDGSVNARLDVVDHIEWCTAYEEMAATVQVMLLRLGIVAARRQVRPGIHSLYVYGTHTRRFRDHVGSIAIAKRFRLDLQVGAETRYVVPVSLEELDELAAAHGGRSFLTNTERNTITRGTISRDKLRGMLDRVTNPTAAADTLRDRLGFHHDRVASITPARGPSVCVRVPDGHRFLQNGFAGWNSQGSEYPCVVVPVHSYNAFMLSRPLLYTAVTRGQRFVYLVGDKKGLQRAVKNDDTTKRHTSLAERLAEKSSHVEQGHDAIR